MKMEHHIVLSAAVSGAVFAVSRSWPMTVSSFVIGVLLDADHVLEYLREFGVRVDVAHFFRASYEREYTKVYLWLHAWEWLPLLVLAAWWSGWNGWLAGVLIGWTQHMIADQIANTPHAWSYFLIGRWRHQFDHQKAFPKRED